MKTELPERSRKHGPAIFKTRDAILEKHRDKIAFIILFGSFARGDWVYDKYYVDHILYEFASDYDFLIITKTPRQGSGHGAANLESDIGGLLDKRNFYLNHTPTFVIEPLDRVNKDLEKGKYFFSDLVKEGILLYDSGEFTLSEKKILSNEEIKEMAVEDYDYWFFKGKGFLDSCNYNLSKKDYCMAAFFTPPIHGKLFKLLPFSPNGL